MVATFTNSVSTLDHLRNVNLTLCALLSGLNPTQKHLTGNLMEQATSWS